MKGTNNNNKTKKNKNSQHDPNLTTPTWIMQIEVVNCHSPKLSLHTHTNTEEKIDNFLLFSWCFTVGC